jgi:hypothetical protein
LFAYVGELPRDLVAAKGWAMLRQPVAVTVVITVAMAAARVEEE